MAIVKAEAVFTTAAGFTVDELERITTAGAGKTVGFRRITNSQFLIPNERGKEEMLTEYARGKTAEEVALKHGMSRRQVFYELKRERVMVRGTTVLLAEKVIDWRARGLSWREIGRLLGVSHEAARQAAGVKETETNTD